MFGYNLLYRKGKKPRNVKNSTVQPCPIALSKGDEAVMGYHPGHAVTPGVEVDFSVDSSEGADIANWTGVVKSCLYYKSKNVSYLKPRAEERRSAHCQETVSTELMLEWAPLIKPAGIRLVREMSPGRILIGYWAGRLWKLGKLGMLHWGTHPSPGWRASSMRASSGSWKPLMMMLSLTPSWPYLTG